MLLISHDGLPQWLQVYGLLGIFASFRRFHCCLSLLGSQLLLSLLFCLRQGQRMGFLLLIDVLIVRILLDLLIRLRLLHLNAGLDARSTQLDGKFLLHGR